MKNVKGFVVALFVMATVVGCGGGSKGGKTDNGPESTPAPTPVVTPVPIQAPAEITGLSLPEVTAGSSAFTLTVSGKNFTEASVVKVDGVTRNATGGSATTIDIPMTAADLATPGTRVITVDSAVVTLTVSKPTWFTEVNASNVYIVNAADGYLYAAYTKEGDVYVCRFDKDGNKVSIGEKTDVHATVDPFKESTKGMVVFGGYAYLVVSREFPDGTGFGNGILVKVNLASGGVREANIMQGGFLTGFAADTTGTIYIALNYTDNHEEYKSAVVGYNASDAAKVFEEGWTNSPRITAVAVSGDAIYMGGVVTNAAGGQARMYARKEDKMTKAILWESQVYAITASATDDTMYPGSFVLDAANDALYFSGAIGYRTGAAKGAIFKIKASSVDGDFSWAKGSENGLEYAFGPIAVDETGSLYGYNWGLDSIFRMSPADPFNQLWRAKVSFQPNCIMASGGVVYVPYPSGKIVRIDKTSGLVIN